MAYSIVYEFASATGSENNDWIYNNADGTQGLSATPTGGKWSWSDSTTPSNKVGPTGGHTHGYIYTESSSPTRVNDVFSVESTSPIDASSGKLSLEYFTSVNTRDSLVQFTVSIWDGKKWKKEVDERLGGTSTEWIETLINLNGYINTDLKIKFSVKMLSDGTVWQKDFGLDSIKIVSSEESLKTDVETYLESKGHKKARRGKGKAIGFTSSDIDSATIRATIVDIEQQVTDGTLVLETSVIIKESDNISHLIKAK